MNEWNCDNKILVCGCTCKSNLYYINNEIIKYEGQ